MWRDEGDRRHLLDPVVPARTPPASSGQSLLSSPAKTPRPGSGAWHALVLAAGLPKNLDELEGRRRQSIEDSAWALAGSEPVTARGPKAPTPTPRPGGHRSSAPSLRSSTPDGRRRTPTASVASGRHSPAASSSGTSTPAGPRASESPPAEREQAERRERRPSRSQLEAAERDIEEADRLADASRFCKPRGLPSAGWRTPPAGSAPDARHTLQARSRDAGVALLVGGTGAVISRARSGSPMRSLVAVTSSRPAWGANAPLRNASPAPRPAPRPLRTTSFSPSPQARAGYPPSPVVVLGSPVPRVVHVRTAASPLRRTVLVATDENQSPGVSPQVSLADARTVLRRARAQLTADDGFGQCKEESPPPAAAG